MQTRRRAMGLPRVGRQDVRGVLPKHRLAGRHASSTVPHGRSVLGLACQNAPMAIDVQAVGERFQLSVSPPDGGPWSSSELLTPTEALEQLSRLGVHQTAAMDALDASGLYWQPIHDAEVMRRRETRCELGL